MKNRFVFSLMIALLSFVGVSCSASPPLLDVGMLESKIKQEAATEFAPVKIMALSNYEFDLGAVVCEETFFVPDVKRQPIVQSVCPTNAPSAGVDGRAVLSWCINNYSCHRILDLGFHYLKGRATEYRC